MKKAQKMERKLVSHVENNEAEVKSIASNHKIPISQVRIAMVTVGKNGKPSRSRKLIYAELRKMGHVIKTKKY